MASELSESVWNKWTVTGDLRELIDAELREVGDVLDGLRNRGCWCGVDPVSDDEYRPAVFVPHSDACVRALVLYEKLIVSRENS